MLVGKYNESSYVGLLPDGTVQEFVSDTEYVEAYREATGEE